jgi:hypothetical protein
MRSATAKSGSELFGNIIKNCEEHIHIETGIE